MTKWEYRIDSHVRLRTHSLNSWGIEGWELVAVTEKQCIFKRPLSSVGGEINNPSFASMVKLYGRTE